MTDTQKSDADELVVPIVGGIALISAVVYLAAVWPVLVWSTIHGNPTWMTLSRALGGGFRWFRSGLEGSPRDVRGWRIYHELVPPKAAWITLDILLLLGFLAICLVLWARVDRWRGRRWLGRRVWDPRRELTPRSWAEPRDLVHLQPRGSRSSRPMRRVITGLQRRVYRERRTSDPAGGDSWPLGRLRGAALRSGPEMHLLVVAPTRAGKSTRVVIPAAREHDGPAVVLSSKTDVVHNTIDERARRGPVWLYAPMTDPGALPAAPCGWTPLHGCADWDYALRMGRWMFDADPSASAMSDQSGGARFYNREAVDVVLPVLLHAADIAGRSMAEVLRWLRSGVDGLDEPRALLADHGAVAAADQLAGVQALDERPRSLLIMSAAQLVDVYRFPALQAADRPDFNPHDLLNGGTLYLIAPDSEQDALAPVFAGVLGAILRVYERAAADPAADRPLLKILADEAAHLAPLAKLPGHLAVSGGWGVRWCLVYQSLSQLQARYREEADAIRGNALAKLFLGPIHDESTRRYLADLLDEETATVTSRNEIRLSGETSRTRHERQRPKVSAQRLMQLAPGEAVVVHGRDLPALTYLPAHWEANNR
jgi:type IV secretory pathway TraG/TraD family ATPase VirD4